MEMNEKLAKEIDLAAGSYYEAVKAEKEAKRTKDKTKGFLVETSSYGTAVTASTTELETTNYYIKDTNKKLKKVTEEAVSILENKKLDEHIKSTVTVVVNEGVDTSKIPAKLLKDMEKYFNFPVAKEVVASKIIELFETELLTQDEFDKCLTFTASHTIKVEKK